MPPSPVSAASTRKIMFVQLRTLSPFVFCLAVALGFSPVVGQQTASGPAAVTAPLSQAQVIEKLVAMNRRRAEALHSYQASRTYKVEYRGFPGSRSAEMVVSVKYQSPGTKEFTVQSSKGSKIIIDRVFKKLLESEQEALTPEMQRRTALTEDNYRFTLVDFESAPSAASYVLKVEPTRKDKFLYAGRIWVDATDFAVVRLQAEPAKNPSFWTKNSEIEQLYSKVDDFWLPKHNHSKSSIRLGGTAELTIEYNDYEITGADPVNRPAPAQQSAPSQNAISAR